MLHVDVPAATLSGMSLRGYSGADDLILRRLFDRRGTRERQMELFVADQFAVGDGSLPPPETTPFATVSCSSRRV